MSREARSFAAPSSHAIAPRGRPAPGFSLTRLLVQVWNRKPSGFSQTTATHRKAPRPTPKWALKTLLFSFFKRETLYSFGSQQTHLMGKQFREGLLDRE